MAQSRAKRNQRAKRTGPVAAAPASATTRRSNNIRRIVIAFLVLVGLAGILAVSAPSGDGDGAPATPGRSAEPAR